MFASFDPVALDMACVDAVNAQTPLRGSAADDAHAKAHVHDHFQRLHPDTNWRSCLEHGEKIGIGTREYIKSGKPPVRVAFLMYLFRIICGRFL